jgi:hypothetical protein
MFDICKKPVKNLSTQKENTSKNSSCHLRCDKQDKTANDKK